MNEAETRAELIDPKFDGNNKIVIGAEGAFQTHENNAKWKIRKYQKQSNVAMAHPTAAELRGMTCHRFATHFFIRNPKVSFACNLPVTKFPNVF